MPARTSNASCGWETRNGVEWGGVNGKLRRNKQKALAFVPYAAHYFCIISSNLTERVGIRFGSLPTAVGIGYFLGEQESNGICIKKLNDRKQEVRNKK